MNIKEKLIITNLPSFYKIELYNRIAEQKDILVIYTGENGSDRNKDFFHGSMKFDSLFLKGDIIKKVSQLLNVLYKINYQELIASGWDSLFVWLAVWISPRRKNSVVVESTIKESVLTGIKGWLKKLFVKKITKAYVSGTPHAQLMNALGFKGNLVITKGVGLFHYRPQPPFVPRSEVRQFLYVGRLVPVKNLEFLIEKFNQHPELELTVIGFGILENKLKSIAKDNIHFLGAVDNEKLPTYYQNADVFILPSLSEPWGLVVEEALNNGTPVMVSEQVGCAEDLVNENTGVVFSLKKNDFDTKLNEIRDINRYNSMRRFISTLDYEKIEQEQVNCYL